ncbi:MAG TPA: flagellar biosynthetic protein FliO [Anaeromyxobacteraceae bacterium]|nr:flagellar biosynthetic protein FliO [Anaeromyxobacteraceae bacterium]
MELPTSTASTSTANSSSTSLPAPYPAPPSSFSGGSIAAGLLLAAMAAAALVLARRRRHQPRLVEIVESAGLGPKRSLVIVRLGDELLVLGSSEGGISLLATRPAGVLASTATSTPEPSALSVAAPEATRSRRAPTSTALAGAALGLIDRLKRWPRPEAVPSFDAALAESGEDEDLRRKLAAGRAGSVR